MNKLLLLNELKRNLKDVRFERLCRIIEVFGFKYRGGKGSHKIFVKTGVIELVNIQDVKGKAKPYQVRQFIKIIEKYNLLKED